MSRDRLTAGILKKLFNLEVMAVQIYRTQVDALAEVGERSMMVAAMENEEYHRETFRSLLKARGLSPSVRWPFYWIVGQILGRSTSLLGRKVLLRGDIAFEDKATREYSEIVHKGDFTDDERTFISEFLDDEKQHAANWRRLLES
jgi:demethoxyubiquinone hydroxylase (CLK1/Coq7/Cat5 family)